MVDLRAGDFVRFHRAFECLERTVGGNRTLSACDGTMQWPAQGMYSFFEDGESLTHSDNGLRVVRVGFHAVSSDSRTTLCQRLSQHRGVARTASGSHRGSVFRLLVSTALVRRDPRQAQVGDV